MTFSVTANPTTQELSEAVNYLLANFSQTMAINPNTGSITTANYGVVSYLYKYLYVRYADSYDGTVNFSNVSTDRLYYGIRNNDSATESTDPADYQWLPVTGGFGTTKFFWYNTTGGRQIETFIGPVRPDINFVKDNGNAIDLDLLTTAAEDKTDPVAADNSAQIQALEQAIGMIPQPQLGTMSPQNAENVAITGGAINGTSVGATTAATGHFTSALIDTPLGIASGGTNTSATPTLGGVTYGTGTSQAYTPTGSSGQFLTSSGAGAPTWTSATALAGAVGYYGAYSDTTTVTATSTTVAYLMNINTIDLQNGVSLVGGNQITVANAGIYNIQFSAQFSNPNAAIADVSVWFRINGVDVTDGAGTNGVPAKHGSSDGLQIVGWNSIFSLNAGDYIQLVWHSDVTNVQLITIPGTTGPVVPESPSLIVTIQALSQIGIGYYGQTSTTSTTIGTGSKTFTVTIPATTTAFTVGTRVRFAYTTTPSNFMEGVITAFAGTSMTVLVDLTGGSGTYAAWSVSVAGNQGTGAVTSISVVSANGLAGTSSGGATPALTLSTSITGLLKGNGTAISAAVANTDYVPLSTVLTKTADYTIANTDAWIINNKTGSALTLTFPAASSWTGRSITIKNMQAQLVNSASSNIVPIDSVTAGTAILLNVIGNWATMVSDGTNWVIMQAASNNNLLLE